MAINVIGCQEVSYFSSLFSHTNLIISPYDPYLIQISEAMWDLFFDSFNHLNDHEFVFWPLNRGQIIGVTFLFTLIDPSQPTRTTMEHFGPWNILDPLGLGQTFFLAQTRLDPLEILGRLLTNLHPFWPTSTHQNKLGSKWNWFL